METKGEKGVYRRNIGIFMLIIGTIMGILTGFIFYNIETMVLGIILSTGAALLGIGNVTDIWKTKK